MLTRLRIRNLKRFEDVDIPLDSPVLFVGPNNSGKTTALQALALWELGLRRWTEKRPPNGAPERRPGVAISHRDLLSSPAPDAKHLWRRLRVRRQERSEGTRRTRNIRIEIVVEGRSNGSEWSAGLEFDYANPESFYCRPLRNSRLPAEASGVRIAYLPPMSGLAKDELRLEPGGVQVRVGEGRTAEVLRNLCFQVHEENPEAWRGLTQEIEGTFGVELESPHHIRDRGEIRLGYRENDVRYDITSSGRGLLQTTLLLAHLALHRGSVLVLDEPDAHLEVVRQRQTYDLLKRVAAQSDSQLILATHSEVLLGEASGTDEIIAFVGDPHPIGQHASGVQKALRDIGYGDYERARQAGFVLYVKGTTDVLVLRAFAERLGHTDALKALDAAFVKPVGNQPMEAVRHFVGLREAQPRLTAFALFDRLGRGLPDMANIPADTWKRREIENYLASPGTLEAWAGQGRDLFVANRQEAMRSAIDDVKSAHRFLHRGEEADSPDAKASEVFLPTVFDEWFRRIGRRDAMPKRRFHELAAFIPDSDLDPEIGQKLDRIVAAYSG